MYAGIVYKDGAYNPGCVLKITGIHSLALFNFTPHNIIHLLQFYGLSHPSSSSAEGREVGRCDLY